MQSTDAHIEMAHRYYLTKTLTIPTSNYEHSLNKQKDSIYKETEDVKKNQMEIYN